MIDSLYIGKRDVKEDGSFYPIFTGDNSCFELTISDVKLVHENDILSIYNSDASVMKLFVQMQAKLYDIMKSKVRVKDEATLRNMLLLTDFDADGHGFVKLSSPGSTPDMPSSAKAVKLTCKGFVVQKKRISIVWDFEPIEEDDDDIIVIVPESEIDEMKKKFEEDLATEIDSMSQVYENSKKLVDVLKNIKKMVDDDYDLQKMEMYMDEYMKTKDSLFEF